MPPKNYFKIREVLVKFACAKCGNTNSLRFSSACRKARRCHVCKFPHELGLDFMLMEDSWQEIAKEEIERIKRTIKPAAGKSKVTAKRAQRAAR